MSGERTRPVATTPYRYGRFVGRVGGLAVALGIGAAIANSPAIAAADDGESSSSETSSSKSDDKHSATSSESSTSSATTSANTHDDDEQKPTGESGATDPKPTSSSI